MAGGKSGIGEQRAASGKFPARPHEQKIKKMKIPKSVCAYEMGVITTCPTRCRGWRG